jgi:hypothetical protein
MATYYYNFNGDNRHGYCSGDGHMEASSPREAIKKIRQELKEDYCYPDYIWIDNSLMFLNNSAILIMEPDSGKYWISPECRLETYVARGGKVEIDGVTYLVSGKCGDDLVECGG